MKRAILACVAVAAFSAAAGGGLMFLKPHLVPLSRTEMMSAVAQEAGAVIYYRHPDGLPAYSLTPAKTPDGRDYLPVPKGADISFDPAEDAPAVADAQKARRLKYYRNPMGLPDTSPVPKKDSMGMDYIAVYDDEDATTGRSRSAWASCKKPAFDPSKSNAASSTRPCARRERSNSMNAAYRSSRCVSKASSNRSKTSRQASTSTRASR